MAQADNEMINYIAPLEPIGGFDFVQYYHKNYSWIINESNWSKGGKLRLDLDLENSPGPLQQILKAKSGKIEFGDIDADGARDGLFCTICCTDTLEDIDMVDADIVLHDSPSDGFVERYYLENGRIDMHGCPIESFTSITGEFKKRKHWFLRNSHGSTSKINLGQLFKKSLVERVFIVDATFTITMTDGCLNDGDITTVSPESKSGFMEDVKSIMDNQEASDFDIFCDGKQFKCHKNILVARSETFKNMLQGDTPENIELKVVIKNATSEAVERMLEHIYTGEFPELKHDGLNLDILQLADMYKLNRLKYFCGEKIIAQLSTSNCISSFIIIDKYFATDSKERELAKLFMRCKAVDIIESDDWGKMIKEFPDVVTEIVRAMLQGEGNVHSCLFCL